MLCGAGMLRRAKMLVFKTRGNAIANDLPACRAHDHGGSLAAGEHGRRNQVETRLNGSGSQHSPVIFLRVHHSDRAAPEAT